MRLSKDHIMFLGVLTAVTVAYFAVVYRWQASTLQEVRAASARGYRQLKADAEKADRIAPMTREIEEMRRRFNKDWDRRLPQRQELAGFLREIAANLSEAGLSNQMIQPGSPSRGPLYNRLPITMKFEGNFLALAGFLRRVDEMERLTRIEKLQIKAAPNAPDGRKLDVELGMNIYFTDQ